MPNTTTQPSFIPRETPNFSREPRRQKGITDLLTLLSIVLFVASVALAAGVFLYKEYLRSSASSKVSQLKRAKAAFEPSLIRELTRLDDRMRSAGDVLGGHISPTAFFRMLEQTTIASIAYASLDFEAIDTQHMTVKMDGVAGSVNAIALQADLFSKGGVITSPIFSNINREPDGIHFDLSARINPAAINYIQLVAGAAASGGVAPQPDVPPLTAPAAPANEELNVDAQGSTD